MNLSEKILYCRQKAGLSQEELAGILRVSSQSISKWETGTSTPEVDKLLLLAKTFGVSTDWLLSEDEPSQDIPNNDRNVPSSEPPHRFSQIRLSQSSQVHRLYCQKIRLARRNIYCNIRSSLCGDGFPS